MAQTPGMRDKAAAPAVMLETVARAALPGQVVRGVEARALATAAKTATVELAATAERAATAVTVSPVLTRFLMALDSKVETAAMAASAAPLGLVAPGTRQVRVDHQVLMETAVTAQMAAKAARGDWVDPVASA